KDLRARRPNLYEDEICPTCFAEKETLEHLIECEEYQVIWNMIEEESAEKALAILQKDAEETEKPCKDEIKNSLFGASKENKRETRLQMVKGLIQTKWKKSIQNLV